MSATTKDIRLLVLWEDEIRKAAALLTAAQNLMAAEKDDTENTKLTKDTTLAIYDALDACAIALNGADNADALLMLSAQRVESAK